MLIGVVLFALAAISGVVAYLFFFKKSSSSDFRNMMSGGPSTGGDMSYGQDRNISPEDLERIKREAKSKTRGGKQHMTLEQKMFRAGMFSEKERADFYRLRVLAPVIAVPVIGSGLWTFAGAQFGMIGILLGAVVGYQIPFTLLDKRIFRRDE